MLFQIICYDSGEHDLNIKLIRISHSRRLENLIFMDWPKREKYADESAHDYGLIRSCYTFKRVIGVKEFCFFDFESLLQFIARHLKSLQRNWICL